MSDESKQLDELCTPTELAAYWGILKNSILAALLRGDIPGASKLGNRWVIESEVALAGWQPEHIRLANEGKPPQRDSSGAFLKGNTVGVGQSGGAGRPSRLVETRYLEALSTKVTPDRWAAICDKAIIQAEGGCRHARVWLGNYLMGTPIQRIAAEVDVNSRRNFEEGERARAIQALLAAAKVRQEAEIIDVESSE